MNRVIDRATGPIRDGTAQDIAQVFHSNDDTSIGRPSEIDANLGENGCAWTINPLCTG